MLSADDHPGIFTFLVGMIVLVMAGVGLSLLVDRRFKFSSGTGDCRRELIANASELAELSLQRDEWSRSLADSGKKLGADARELQQIFIQLATMSQRRIKLEESRSSLRDRISSLEKEFARYRGEYRSKTWSAAVGEKLGNLRLRSGRQFMQVTITRVTDVGLEVTHESGIARIQAPDLDQELQERFQWRDEERRLTLNDERENMEGRPAEPAEGEADGIPTGSSDQVKIRQAQGEPPTSVAEALPRLRQQVLSWQAQIRRLNMEKAEAASQASYGSQSSVPGSLETWAAKQGRLGAALAKAQGELAVCKSRLAEVAPSDPLLRRSLIGND